MLIMLNPVRDRMCSKSTRRWYVVDRSLPGVGGAEGRRDETCQYRRYAYIAVHDCGLSKKAAEPG